MSLQVWLPLNGNITNQGISNATFTSVGTLSYGIGKVTNKCGTFNGSNRINCSLINLPNTLMSASVWIKSDLLTSGSYYYIFGLSTGSGYATQQLSLALEYASSTTSKLVFIANGISSLKTTININQWYHVIITYDGSTIRGYVNGVSIGAVSTTARINATYFTIGCRAEGSSSYMYYFKGNINDFRLYDHCLSAKEVKELSKGLCVHYPLSVPGENLLVGSGRYISSTQSNKNKDGYVSYPIYANNLTPGTYLYSIEVTKGTLASGHAISGVDYTKGYWALWLYTDSTAYSDSNYAHYTTAACYHSGNLFKREGDRYYWKVTISSGKPNCAVRINTYSDGTNNAVINFGKLKLESGDKSTPFIPHKNDKPYLGLPLDGKSLVNSRDTPLIIGSSTNTGNYQFATFTPNGGGNYPTRVHRIRFDVSVLAGSITQVTCLFYNLSTSTSCGQVNATIVNGVVDIYHTPTTACPNLLIYAGVAGSTANKSIQINNLRVYNEFNVEDTSGYNNNATKIGAISFDSNTPRYLTSMVFNGSNTYVYLPKDVARPTDKITISLWAYKNGTNNCPPISCTEGGGWNICSDNGYLMVNMYTSGKGGYIVASTGKAWSELINTWHHIAVTYDGTAVKIYLDGVMKQSTATSGTIVYANNYTFIGAEAGGNTTTPGGKNFDGKISDVRIYSTCLTENDIKELYQTAASIDNAGNVYSFDYIER